MEMFVTETRASVEDLPAIGAWYREHQHHRYRDRARAAECPDCNAKLLVYDEVEP